MEIPKELMHRKKHHGFLIIVILIIIVIIYLLWKKPELFSSLIDMLTKKT